MYFPYFRGRQYELLALKELATKGLISSSIVPVVEPVKMISTQAAAVKAYKNAGLPLALIFNPMVGELAKGTDGLSPLLPFIADDVIPALLTSATLPNTLRALNLQGVAAPDILAILNNRDYLNVYVNEFGSISPRFTLLPDERSVRRAARENKVIFEDKFAKRNRNADYPEDEFFSEDHLYYEEEGYVGFGDYSIIGDEYVESGFAPYAVAIHIIYFADDKTMRVRHFTSDSNDDTSDVAGKFYEAVSKLAHWWHRFSQESILKPQMTSGLQAFLDHYSNHTYPGLPTVKKLSIMHHLELVQKFLEGGIA